MTAPRVVAVGGPGEGDPDHPAVSDPRVFLTCAGCIRRELRVIIEELRRHRHGSAKLMLMKLYVALSDEIEAAVEADRGRKQ